KIGFITDHHPIHTGVLQNAQVASHRVHDSGDAASSVVLRPTGQGSQVQHGDDRLGSAEQRLEHAQPTPPATACASSRASRPGRPAKTILILSARSLSSSVAGAEASVTSSSRRSAPATTAGVAGPIV